MKIGVLFLSGACLFFFSCQKGNVLSSQRAVTSDLITKSNYSSEEDFFVSTEDMECYSEFMSHLKGKKQKGQVIEVTPVSYRGEVTGYVVNYEDGWQVISSDKRGPIILAESSQGLFNFQDAPKGVQVWLNILFDDIFVRKFYLKEYYKSITKEGVEEEALSCNMWRLFVAGPDAKNNNETKGPPTEPPGRHQYSYTYTTTEYVDGVSHLLQTSWRQNSPYNSLCPFVSTTSSNHCLVGCTALAGAQVLYYLHYFTGMPTASPTSCSFIDNYPIFSAYSPYAWNYIDQPNDSFDYRGMFIASVACEAETNFGEEESGTTVLKLKNGAFTHYGVQCDYSTTYIRDTVFHNIKSHLPVIFGANRYVDLFNYPGHTWVIDGYVNEVITYHDVYEWVYLTEPTGPVAAPPPPYEILSQSSSLKYFLMNWGYGNNHGEDDAYYATDGSWCNPLIPNSNPYVYAKEILTRYR